MKPERASGEGKHCRTHGEDDGYTSGSQRGVRGHAEVDGEVSGAPRQKDIFVYLKSFSEKIKKSIKMTHHYHCKPLRPHVYTTDTSVMTARKSGPYKLSSKSRGLCTNLSV